MNPQGMTARAIAAAVRGGEDPVAIALSAAIRAAENPCNAFVTVDLEAVEAQARCVDRLGPLAGVPVAVKDNLADAGQPLTCASRILVGHRAFSTATAITRLRAAGAVIIGRTNMDEFAMGATSTTSAYGPTRHPTDPGATPGGSSSGSAVSVALGITPLALGSDTGGSIRVPAALCGIVGLKPGWGRVSRRGLVAHACSLDCVGPLTSNVRDSALALACIAGADPRDPTAVADAVPDYVAACAAGVRGLRIGWLSAVGGAVPSGLTMRGLDRAIQLLTDAGARLVPCALPRWAEASGAYAVLSAAEGSSNLARYDGLRYGARVDDADLSSTYAATRSAGFGAEVRRRLLFGAFTLSTDAGRRYYQAAHAARARLSDELSAAFAEVDLLLCPATPDERVPEVADVLVAGRMDAYAIPASLVGVPALVVPVRIDGAHPVGVQLLARPLDESTLFAAAAVIEAAFA